MPVNAFLEEINKDLPAGVDWKAGARRYVKHHFERNGRDATEHYSLTKPFAHVGNGSAVIADMVQYFYNFINMVQLIQPSTGAEILDVACGGGWISHYLTKIGCKTFGIDISEDFVELARKRVVQDQALGISQEDATRMFAVLDLEESPLPAERIGSFDFAVLESCLHHFFDPISAMQHLAEAMKPDGIVVIIEGENRIGPIKDFYAEVMRETETLERPYSRAQLLQILDTAGLGNVEFLGRFNGWLSPNDPAAATFDQQIRLNANAMNLAVCSKTPHPITRLFPHRIRQSTLHFGHGFYEDENGFRWCGPSGELVAKESAENLQVEIATFFTGKREKQTVRVYGTAGERGCAVLRLHAPSTRMNLGRVQAGERLVFCSSEAFSPSWEGGKDARLLSFFVRS